MLLLQLEVGQPTHGNGPPTQHALPPRCMVLLAVVSRVRALLASLPSRAEGCCRSRAPSLVSRSSLSFSPSLSVGVSWCPGGARCARRGRERPCAVHGCAMSAARCFAWGPPPWDKAARLREYEEYRAARKDKHRVRGEEGVGGQSVANEGARLPFFPWRSPRHPRATRDARSLRGRRDAGKGAQGRG